MAPTKLKRAPDAAVGIAVAQVIKQQKSKRMMMFGLRNLSELCSPDKIKYKENSVAAMMEEIVPVIVLCAQSYGDDEDVVLACIKILKGISDHLIEDPDPELLEKLKTDGGIQAGLSILSNCATASDEATLTFSLGYFSNLEKLGVRPDILAFTEALVLSINKKRTPETSHKIFAVLAQVMDNSEVVDVVSAKNGGDKVLEVLTLLNPAASTSAVGAAEAGLLIVQKLARANKASTANMDSVIKTLDNFKGKKIVVDRGSAILASMLGPEELKKCLDALATAPPGSAQRHDALTMLISMSYIASYAEAIVQAGGIKLLCDAVKTSGQDLNPKTPDQQLVRGLNGACKMLEKIAENPANVDNIIDAEGLEALSHALIAVQGIPNSVAFCVETITPLIRKEKNCQAFNKLNGFSTVLETLNKNLKNRDVAVASIRLLSVALNNEGMAAPLYGMGLADITSRAMQHHIDDIIFQTNCIFCLKCTSHLMKDFSEVTPGHKSLLASLKANGAKSEPLATMGFEFIERLISVPGAMSVLEAGETADAVLSMMLSHQDNSNLQYSGKGLLEQIATENDVKRCLADLDRSILNAKTNPEKAYHSLAAVNGLSQVDRLKNIFEQKKAAETIQNGIASWVQTPQFTEQQRIIKAAALSIESLKIGSSNPMDSSILALLTTSQLPQLRSLSEKQDVLDSNLLDLVRTCRVLCSQRQITIENIGSLIEQVTKVSWKYQDLRRVQIECIEMMTELATMGNGAQLLVDSGTLKNVISYMLKVVIYEDVQAAGLRLLAACMTQDPKLIESVKFAGGIEVCKSIQSSHPSSSQIKTLLPPVASALMPSDFLDQDIKKELDSLSTALLDDNIKAAIDAIISLNSLTATTEGGRCAVTNRIGVVLQKVASYSTQNKPELTLDLAVETSKLMKNLCNNRAGVAHLGRCGGTAILSNLLTVITDKQYPDSPAKREGIEANLYAYRCLIKSGNTTDDAATCKRQIATFCMLIEAYPEDNRIGGAAAAALATVPNELLTKSAEFGGVLRALVDKMNSDNIGTIATAARSLAELLGGPDDDRFNLLEKIGGTQALFKSLDEHGNDSAVRNSTLDALTAISLKRNISHQLRSAGGDGAVTNAVGILVRTLNDHCENDAKSAESIVRLLNKVTTSKDRKLLADLGVIDIAADLMSKHPDNKELMTALGELLGKAGAGDAIDVLMAQIITVGTQKSTDWRRSLEVLCSKLAVLLPADVDNVSTAFSRSPEMCNVLAEIVLSEKDDPALVGSIALVSRRLVDRFESDPANIAYGVNAVHPKLMPALAQVLAVECKAHQNKNFVMNAYRTLAVVATNPKTHASVVQQSKATNLIPATFVMLKNHQNDCDVSARILEYLRAIGGSPDGIELVVSQYSAKPGKATPEEQITSDIIALMRKHKKHGGLVSAGVSLIEALGLRQQAVLQPLYLKEVGLLAEETPEGLVALMKALCKFMDAGHKGLVMGEILKIQERFSRLYQDPATAPAQKRQLAIGYADFIAKLAESGEVDEIKKAGAVETLVGLLEDFSDDPVVLISIMRALKEMADLDADLNAKIARQVPSMLMGICAPTIKGDPVLCEAALGLLYSLGCSEGNGRLLASTVGFSNLMTAFDLAIGNLPPAQAEEMRKLLNSFKYMVDQDNPKALTLEQVYEKWNARKAAGESLDLSESIVVLQQFDFVCDYTDEYSKAALPGIDTELGSEFRFGCLCFSLLHEYPLNTSHCIEKGEARTLLKAIDAQKVEAVAHCAILAARDFCAHGEAAVNFGSLPDSQTITTNAVRRLPRGTGSPEDADEMMIPRLELVERCAVTRHHYDGTLCMETLISVWDDYDRGCFTTETLRRTFRAMRRIVNETWVDTILSNQIPKRLIDFINKQDQDLTLLPDVLFLIGALATVPEIKTLLGELKGSEACLDLVVRCLKNTTENTSPVQTNACLALANITIGHGPNIAKFVAAKGIETNVEVMVRSMADSYDYDVANAASVLMCNLCYRRDDVKQLFGDKGGPKAVTETIRKYDGSDSKSAFRCLGSMLKAIGNLALYTPNVTTFLNQGIEETFAHLYSNSEFLPDELLEVSLRTMSNLVLENTDEFMQKFGVVMLPLLSMLHQTRRESVRMLALAFEVLGNLCRLAINAEKFADNDGINITLRIVNTHSDARLSAATIHLLGVQTNNPDCMGKLIEAGVFKFLSNLFESQAAAEERQQEVCVAGLRCVRRLLLGKLGGDTFIDAGGPNAILNLMHSCPDMSMVQLDSYKNIITLLNLYPSPPPLPSTTTNGGGDLDWDAEVADEGVLGLIHRMERPPSPRSWETVGFDADMVRRLIVSICACLLAEGHARQIKLQRCGLGLLAYFACEKLPGAVEGFYTGAYHSVVKTALLNLGSDIDIVKTCCYILNNVSYVSEAEDYRMVAKDKGLRTALEEIVPKIPKKNIQTKDYCTTTLKLLADRKDPDPKKFESLVEWDYPLELTEWNKDPYPNGVQDLPADIKKSLREGARAKIFTDSKVRYPFWWKSSQDMSLLQWKTTDDPTASYNQQIPISRIRNVSKGLATPTLEAAAAKDWKVDDKVCLVLVGPATEEAPNGMELNLKLKSKKERDQLWYLISEWRDAATYGF